VLQKHTQESKPETGVEPITHYCETCSKIFYNEKAFSQHNSSKKHAQMLAVNTKRDKRPSESKQVDDKSMIKTNEKEVKVEDVPVIVDGDAEDFNDSDWEEMEEDEEILEGIPFNECLFCSESSENLETNLTHMSQAHSFYIPDLEYCIDLKGLMNYLGIKIASGFCCLWCSEHGKQFASKKSAQQHMMDKGHTKMKLESGSEVLLEFEDFYDYTTSYPEGEANDELDPEELNLDNGDYQLKLPSGTVIGHRSLVVYYKQHLKPEPTEKKSKNKELLNKVMSQYKALGWVGSGLTSKDAVQKAKDIYKMQRRQQKYQLKLGKQHNSTLQTHFRYQMGFT